MALVQIRQCDECDSYIKGDVSLFRLLELKALKYSDSLTIETDLELADKDLCSLGCLTKHINRRIADQFNNGHS